MSQAVTLFASTLSAVTLETFLARLAVLFLAGAKGDLTAAHLAASRMLAAYHAETEDELRLAAEIISFSFHALEALSQAAAPDMPLTRVLRLRGGAVSLSREAHKSQRKLDQLQRDRHTGRPAPTAEASTAEIPTAGAAAPDASAAPLRPQIDKALALIEATRHTAQNPAAGGGKTWTQSYQQRQTARRITENLKKHQARHPAPASAPPPAAPDAAALPPS